jgi:POT family proton-dependent oligopeptide transporter
MPVSWVQSINPIFIILFSGIFAAVWTRLGPRQPSTPLKFAMGTASIGIAFLMFLPLAGGGANSTSLLAFTGILFVLTIAELLLSPVGLSLSTKLAPKAFQTQMVALFFLSVALGTAMSGVLARFYDSDNEAPYFGLLGAITIALGCLLAFSARPIGRLMGNVR